jgi:hypothetical protein
VRSPTPAPPSPSSGRDFAVVGKDFAVVGRDFAVVGWDFGAVGRDFGAVGRDFGAVGRDFGAVGRDFGAVGKDFGVVGKDFGVVGKDFGAVGKDFGAVGKDFGAVGRDFGAVGRDFGAVGKDFGVVPRVGSAMSTDVVARPIRPSWSGRAPFNLLAVKHRALLEPRLPAGFIDGHQGPGRCRACGLPYRRQRNAVRRRPPVHRHAEFAASPSPSRKSCSYRWGAPRQTRWPKRCSPPTPRRCP